MNLVVDPPIKDWRLKPSTVGGHDRNREVLVDGLQANAHRLGLAQLHISCPVIATGHQASLWHPGILAKDLAVLAAADSLGAGALHVVVDQDTHEAYRLELPVIQDQQLTVEVVQLGECDREVPTGFQPAVDSQLLRQDLLGAKQRLGRALAADIAPLIAAFTDLPPCHTIAEQIAVVISRLRGLATSPCHMPIFFASQLRTLPAFGEVLEKMLRDPLACVSRYNQSVDAAVTSGMLKLVVEPDRVELPLWALRWGEQRHRVFADLSDSKTILTLANGQRVEIDLEPADHQSYVGDRFMLAPKALLMTALLRRWCCELFVHGHGGGHYDLATEDWWSRWQGEELAPMAVVSADLFQDFEVPFADTATFQRAVWWTQHLKYNVDRVKGVQSLDPQIVARKRYLLDHMNDDRDRVRRAAAFAEIRQINDDLVRMAPDLMLQAQQQLDRARSGIANQTAARKRDWCFALYDRARLRAMSEAFADGHLAN